MRKEITIKVTPIEEQNETLLKEKIADELGKPVRDINGWHLLRRSLDARSKQVWYQLKLNVFIQEPFLARDFKTVEFREVHNAKKSVVIIGAGPAGLFAALRLIENGIQPIILERGKDVRARRRDLAVLNQKGIINPESNYCFGEGGAGTYSDGKLYTRSNKRGSIQDALNLFVQFGADEKILYEAHPHIGTNKLPQIITSMRQQIIACGGAVHFEEKVVDFIIEQNSIVEAVTSSGNRYKADGFILATGHSARDIFELLHRKNILIEAKPFALGVRVEHPQEIINRLQYKCSLEQMQAQALPPASYSLVEQVTGKGVFSFCMCPGGVIAAASTNVNELVVNGWSPSKRNNPFANSGMVVQIDIEDAFHYFKGKIEASNPLLLMHFQAAIEQSCYTAGGGHFKAPAQRMVDFSTRKVSQQLNECSYIPGVSSVNLHDVLPSFVSNRLAEAFVAFGKKMKGYYTNEAMLLATESRTSSPIRIPRDKDSLAHLQINNLYPCGEGAGFAGGIISAAMDGKKIADQIIASYL